MNRRDRFLTTAIISAVILTGVLVILAVDDNHKTNLKYLMWKHHLHRYEPDLALKYFNVDGEFRSSLLGKSKADVERWFPILQPVDPADPYLPYCGNAVKQPGFVWIDGPRWGIVFENGRVKNINQFKG